MYNLNEILNKSFDEMNDEELFISQWKEKGIYFLNEYYNGELPNFDMTMNEFLDNCIACGGNWGGMLLSGIAILNPLVYSEIPDQLGFDGNIGFICLCMLLKMLGVREK